MHGFFWAGLQPKSLTSTLQVLPDLVVQVKRGQGTIPDLQTHSEAGPLYIGFMVVRSKDLEPQYLTRAPFPTIPVIQTSWETEAKQLQGLVTYLLGDLNKINLESNKIECTKHLTWCRSNTDFTGYRRPELSEAKLQQFIPLLSGDPELLRSGL